MCCELFSEKALRMVEVLLAHYFEASVVAFSCFLAFCPMALPMLTGNMF